MPQPLVGHFAYDKVKGTPIARPSRTTMEQGYVSEIARGIGVTMSHFFKNTKDMLRGTRPDAIDDSMSEGITTLQYPEQKRPYPARFRGLHRLTHRQDGSPRCVACLCCSTACPAQCIYIEAGEYEQADKRHGYERYPVKFVIDELRCIFCGYCVEACPCDAIRMDTGLHAVPYDSRDQFIYGKNMLLAMTSIEGKQLHENPRAEPPDEDFPGVTREAGAH